MTTYFAVALLLIALVVLYRRLRRPATTHVSANLWDIEMDPHMVDSDTRNAVARCRATQAAKRERADRAYSRLAEARERFGEVLEEQRGRVADTGKAKGWSAAQVQGGIRRMHDVYDGAWQSEIECAKRLFGARAVETALDRLG